MSLSSLHHPPAQGFGLIEVLVSLLIITISVVGMAGLHSKSLQYNQVAYFYSQGIALAADMFGRITMNRQVALHSNHYVVDEDTALATCAHDHYPATCENGDCSPVQLAAYDVEQWQWQVACQLPGTVGTIAYEQEATGRTYVITLALPAHRGAVPLDHLVFRSAL